MSNASTILSALDKHLKRRTPLILYGRAALVLGFADSPSDASLSVDVDVILTTEQSENLDEDEDFWTALEAANSELSPLGLYVTHLFEESQVTLRPDWKQHLVPIGMPAFKWLDLSRPHALDLLLTKMMRGSDPQDMMDANFIIKSQGLKKAAIENAIAVARVPDIEEIRDAFRSAIPKVLAMVD